MSWGAGLTLIIICVAAAGLLVKGVSDTGPAINERPHQIQNYASIKQVSVLILGFLMFLSAVPPGFSSALDHRRTQAEQRRWYIVSESSGAGSHWLSCIKGRR